MTEHDLRLINRFAQRTGYDVEKIEYGFVLRIPRTDIVEQFKSIEDIVDAFAKIKIKEYQMLQKKQENEQH